MLKPGGYFISTDPDPRKGTGQTAVVERDSVTCGHCNRIVLVKPMCQAHEMTYALCWGCRRNICLACDAERAKTLTCDVIEKKLERWEAADRFRREVG